MNNLLYIFIGGGIGSCLRYLVQFLTGKTNYSGFPIATFIVNVIGCFVIGFVAGLLIKYKLNPAWTFFIITGLLGGFTTFSSFALEFVELVQNNKGGIALLYVILTNFVGLALSALGLYCIK